MNKMKQTRLYLAFVAIIVAVAALVMVPTASAAPTVREVETLPWSTGTAPSGTALTDDPAASGQKTLGFYGTTTGTFTLSTDAIANVIVRARGADCFGPPNLKVTADNKVLGERPVGPAYTDYSFAANLPAGSHTISLAYTNDFWFFCDRNLYLDVLTLSVPAPPTTTTTTPPPTTTTTTPPTTTTTTPPASPVPTGVPGSWRLTFQDEFSGTSLDRSKWSNCWFPPTCGTQNDVKTSPANITVSGGNATLTLSDSSTGASMSTNPVGGSTAERPNPGYEFRAGVTEARVFFPGNGTQCYNWPGFWTTGQNWPATGENDVAEVLSDGSMTVNYHSSSGAHNQGAVPGYWCGGFHTYTLNRQATRSDVYYDGVLVKSYATDDGGAPHYLVVNVGQSHGIYHAYGAASQIKVDYVRAWQ